MKRFAVFILILCASAAFGIQARFVSTDALWTWLNNHETRIDAIEAPVWDDLRFPASSINLAGAPVAPDQNITNFLGALTFPAAKTCDVAFMAQMPHAWENGTMVDVHLHCVNGTGTQNTATTTWEIRIKKADAFDNFPNLYTVATKAFTLANSTFQHQLIELAEVDMTGLGDSAMMAIWVRRISESGAGVHNGDIHLLELDIHYQTEKRGSIGEYGER